MRIIFVILGFVLICGDWKIASSYLVRANVVHKTAVVDGKPLAKRFSFHLSKLQHIDHSGHEEEDFRGFVADIPLLEDRTDKENTVTDMRRQIANVALPALAACSVEPAMILIEDRTDKQNTVADLRRQIANVALPALAVCIVEPAMTLIDMFFVSRSSGDQAAAKLAALSVNGAIFNIIAAATYPLCTGATALVSRALAKSATTSEIDQADKLQKILLNGIFLSLLSGSSLFAGLQLFGGVILRKGFTLSDALYDSARGYMTIRSFSLPFALITYVIIGFSLGVQSTLIPAVSIFSSALTNMIGDFLLCEVYKQGLNGAALATSMAATLSTIVSLFILLKNYIFPKVAAVDLSKQTLNNAKQQNSFVMNPFTYLMSGLQGFIGQLDIQTLRQFFSTSMLLLLGTFSNTLTYSAGSKISSVVAGGASEVTVHMAAHQIVMQLWWFISFFSTPLSMAAQALLPRFRGDVSPETSTHASEKVKVGSKVLRVKLPWEAFAMRNQLFLVGLNVAAFCTTATAVALQVVAPRLFTTDPAVLSLVKQVAPTAIVSMFVICLTTLLDGMFIGMDAIGEYIVTSILSSAAAWLYYTTQSLPKKIGIVGAWRGLLIFALVRASCYVVCWRKIVSLNPQKKVEGSQNS